MTNTWELDADIVCCMGTFPSCDEYRAVVLDDEILVIEGRDGWVGSDWIYVGLCTIVEAKRVGLMT